MAEMQSARRSLRSVMGSQVKVALGGLVLVLVPAVIVGQSLEKTYAIAHQAVETVAPGIKAVGGVGVAITIVLLLLGVCWLLGAFATRTQWGRRLREWERAKFGGRSPLVQRYDQLTGMHPGEGPEESRAVQPALANIAGDWQPGVIVEEQDGGWATVFVPEIPDVSAGRLYCLREEQVLRLSVPLDEFKQKLTKGGHGSQDWLRTIAERS